MSAADLITPVLLGLGVLFMLSGIVGVLVARDIYDRLHFTGPASIFAPLLIALAVTLDSGALSQAGLKSILVAVLIIALNPVLVHATARAARIEERGQLDYGDAPGPEDGQG